MHGERIMGEETTARYVLALQPAAIGLYRVVGTGCCACTAAATQANVQRIKLLGGRRCCSLMANIWSTEAAQYTHVSLQCDTHRHVLAAEGFAARLQPSEAVFLCRATSG